MNRPSVLVAVGVSVLLLGACSAPAEETASDPTPTAVETATPTPTPTPTPTVEAEPAGPEIVVDEAALEGDAKDVHGWVETFTTEVWRTLTTNEVSPAFSIPPLAAARAQMDALVATNTAAQAQVGGTLHAAISDVVVTGDDATAVVCEDYSDVTYADAEGPKSPEQLVENVRRKVTVTLVRSPQGPGIWALTGYEDAGTC